MNAPAGRPPIADDGDELHFCSTCAFSAACVEQGYMRVHGGRMPFGNLPRM